MIMPRKKTQQQIEFAKTVEYRPNALGVMRPVKYAGRKQETRHRSTYGRGKNQKAVRIDAALYDHIVSQKGDLSIAQFVNQLVRKGAQL